jgi:hypothetical protein
VTVNGVFVRFRAPLDRYNLDRPSSCGEKR